MEHLVCHRDQDADNPRYNSLCVTTRRCRLHATAVCCAAHPVHLLCCKEARFVSASLPCHTTPVLCPRESLPPSYYQVTDTTVWYTPSSSGCTSSKVRSHWMTTDWPGCRDTCAPEDKSPIAAKSPTVTPLGADWTSQ